MIVSIGETPRGNRHIDFVGNKHVKTTQNDEPFDLLRAASS
jgi:hypothetical protein